MNQRDHISTETLADHAEGLLGESEAGLVDAHLEECADCRSTALLLASLHEILEADDPGPMPARYAARIDATLAELAIAEPVLPAKPAAAKAAGAKAAGAKPAAARGGGGGAEVIDLASRRTVMVGALRRVSTVAAGVVLLIGGAALGVQTLGSHSRPPETGASGDPGSEIPTVLLAFPTAPADAVAGPNGTKVDPKNGTIYSKDKVLYPNGDVVLAPKTAGGPPVVIRPVATPAPAQTTKAGKGTGPLNTAVKPQTPATASGPAAGGNPAVAPTTAAAPPPPAAPFSQPTSAAIAPQPGAGPAAAPAPDSNRPRITSNAEKPSKMSAGSRSSDPYVSQSGTAYTEDNFAAKVMDLLRDAAADHRTSSSGGAQSSTTGKDVAITSEDPAAPPVGPQPDATTAARGPAATDVKARVLRCAAEIPGQAIAGDEGTWQDKPATIVVIPSDHADQVVGYVFYGDCTKPAPATPSDYLWRQQVNDPTAKPTPRSTPSRRVGDITGSGQSQRNTLPAGGAPASSSSPAGAAATPGSTPK